MVRHALFATAMASCVLVTIPASAQDVVMRRPIPSTGTDPSVPTVVDPTDPNGPGTPPTTPPVTPTDPNDPPGTPVDPGTPPVDPFVPTEENPDVPPQYERMWFSGAWFGNPTCGQPSRMNRNVYCLTFVPGGDGPFGGTIERVPDEQCLADAGPKPTTSYIGTAAACYTFEEETTDWKNDIPGGSTVCSADAYRETIGVCRDRNGASVPLSNCEAGLESGGYEQSYDGWYPYKSSIGNYDGCVREASWRIASVGQVACSGEIGNAQVTYQCRFDDGGIADPSDCTTADPSSVRQVAVCGRQYAPLEHQGIGHCNPSNFISSAELPGGNYVQGYGGNGSWFAEANPYCFAAGATCCEVRYNTSSRKYEKAAFSGTGVDGPYGYTLDGQTYYGAYERSDKIITYVKQRLPEYEGY